ncbi:MAG: sensor histidine kinase [Saprospiraceae bacterium]
MIRYINYIILLYLLLFLSVLGKSQSSNIQTGDYPIVNYSNINSLSNVYNQTFTKIVQTGNGEMLLLGNNLPIAYNGNHWLPVELLPDIKSIVINENKVFIANNKDFGVNNVYRRSFFNQNDYKELSHLVPTTFKNYESIEGLFSIKKQLFVLTDKYLFIYENSIFSKGIKIPEKSSAFVVNNELWLWSTDNGLEVFRNDRFIGISNNKNVKNNKPIKIVQSDDGQVLYATKQQLFQISNKKLIRFGLHITELLNKSDDEITAMVRFQSGNWGIGTKKNGLLAISSNGKLIKKNTQSDGLISNQINDLYIDKWETLWVVYQKGVSRLQYEHPVSFYGENHNLPSSLINAMTVFQNRLYVASEDGLFFNDLIDGKFPSTSFNSVNSIQSNCRAFVVTKKELLVATKKGIYTINKNGINQLNTIAVNCLHQSSFDSNRMYIGTDEGLVILKKEQGKWNYTKLPSNKDIKLIHSIAEDKFHNIWLNANDKIWKTTVSTLEKGKPTYKQYRIFNHEGKENSKANLLLFKQEVIFQAENGGYWAFSEKNDSLYICPKQFPKAIGIYSHIDNSGHYYYVLEYSGIYRWTGEDNHKFIILDEYGDTLRTQYHSRDKWSPLIRNKGGFDIMCYSKNKDLYFGLPFGEIGFYNSDIPLPKKWKPSLNIEEISVNNQEKFYERKVLTKNKEIVLEYTQNTIVFTFASIPAFIGKPLQYKYRLFRNKKEIKGKGQSIQTINSIILPTLKDGQYDLHIRTFDQYGQLSNPMIYSFIIKKPWYKSPLAYTFYFLGLAISILIGYILIKKHEERKSLRKQQAKLETLVRQRTKELEQKNNLLEQQNNQIKTLFGELNHRVKNNLQIVISFLSGQYRRSKDTKSKEALQASQNRVKTISLLHKVLYEGNHVTTQLDVQNYIVELCALIQKSYSAEVVELNIDIPKHTMNSEMALPIGLIINELISNSFKYAFVEQPNPKVYIQLKINQNTANLMIKDNGIGLPEGFNIKKSTSYGLKLVQLLTKQIRGQLKFTNNNGTLFNITFNL